QIASTNRATHRCVGDDAIDRVERDLPLKVGVRDLSCERLRRARWSDEQTVSGRDDGAAGSEQPRTRVEHNVERTRAEGCRAADVDDQHVRRDVERQSGAVRMMESNAIPAEIVLRDFASEMDRGVRVNGVDVSGARLDGDDAEEAKPG